MREARKLKRGLKDLSPLFGGSAVPAPSLQPSAPVSLLPAQTTDWLALTHVASDEASHELSLSLARFLTGHQLTCSMLSLKSKGPEFEAMVRARREKHRETQFSHGNLILDAPWQQAFDRVFPFVDKWMVVAPATRDGLMDAFRWIKAARPLNPHVAIYLLFEKLSPDMEGAVIFEQFSELVSRHLCREVHWLGETESPAGTFSDSMPEALFR